MRSADKAEHPEEDASSPMAQAVKSMTEIPDRIHQNGASVGPPEKLPNMALSDLFTGVWVIEEQPETSSSDGEEPPGPGQREVSSSSWLISQLPSDAETR